MVPPPIPPTATRLLQARTLAGIGQADLAQALGRDDYKVIWRLETGRRALDIEEAERLAAWLKVPAPWLAFGERGRAAEVLQLRCRGAGARLREAREHAGLRLRQLAEASGLTIVQISQIERGERTPEVGRAAELARLLGRAAGWLAYG